MKNFNNETYTILVTDLLNDAFYNETRSIRGQIATIRQYAEVFVRRILDLDKNDKVTLGDTNIISKLKDKNNSLLLTSIETIKNYGNMYTHTQYLENPTKEELERVINSLFNLYAYLFIDYFEKNKFGNNNQIMRVFSLLPPIIRYIVLEYLYKLDSKNIHVIDRFILATLKAFSKQEALDWINSRKDELLNMSSLSEEDKFNLVVKYGEVITTEMINSSPNMYELCLDKVNILSKELEKDGLLYHDFESAISFYKRNGKLEGSIVEIKEFNLLMEFAYMGRQERVKLINKY